MIVRCVREMDGVIKEVVTHHGSVHLSRTLVVAGATLEASLQASIKSRSGSKTP